MPLRCLCLVLLAACHTSSSRDIACAALGCVHGSCSLAPDGTPSCGCEPGWVDTQCSTAATGCAPDPCGAGTCSETNAPPGFRCACAAAFQGERCTDFRPADAIDLSTANTGLRSCADGGDMVAYSVVGLGAAVAMLSRPVSPGCLDEGDEVLLISLGGSATAVFNTGAWELLEVASFADAEVRFTKGKLRSYGDAIGGDAGLGVGPSDQRVVLQRVPRYGSVTAAATLTASAWDGQRGGVFALRSDTSFSGDIDMSGKGYRGAATNAVAGRVGDAGESLRGPGAMSRLANVGGGGGGGFAVAGCSPGGTAGGGGALSEAGVAGTTTGCGGAPGAPYGDASFDKIFLGSGGGAGGASVDATTSPPGGAGGAGGGIVLLFVDGQAKGAITANGRAGIGDVVECAAPSPSTSDCWDDSGPGGGGSGGSILVQSAASSCVTHVDGGLGGDGADATAGNGGAGGAGRVLSRSR